MPTEKPAGEVQRMFTQQSKNPDSRLFEWKEITHVQGSRAPHPSNISPKATSWPAGQDPSYLSVEAPTLLRSEEWVLKKGLAPGFCGDTRLILWLLWL